MILRLVDWSFGFGCEQKNNFFVVQVVDKKKRKELWVKLEERQIQQTSFFLLCIFVFLPLYVSSAMKTTGLVYS